MGMHTLLHLCILSYLFDLKSNKCCCSLGCNILKCSKEKTFKYGKIMQEVSSLLNCSKSKEN